VPRVGRRHRGVLCQRPQPPLGKGQPTVVNHGQRLCRELGCGSRHRWHFCRRPNGRAVGTVDGIPNVTTLAPSPTGRPCRALAVGKDLIMPRVPACRLPDPRQRWQCREYYCAECGSRQRFSVPRARESSKPEFLVVMKHARARTAVAVRKRRNSVDLRPPSEQRW
jgi:hypothetical protein